MKMKGQHKHILNEFGRNDVNKWRHPHACEELSNSGWESKFGTTPEEENHCAVRLITLSNWTYIFKLNEVGTFYSVLKKGKINAECNTKNLQVKTVTPNICDCIHTTRPFNKMHLELKSVKLKFVKGKTEVFQFQSQEWLQKTEDRETYHRKMKRSSSMFSIVNCKLSCYKSLHYCSKYKLSTACLN